MTEIKPEWVEAVADEICENNEAARCVTTDRPRCAGCLWRARRGAEAVAPMIAADARWKALEEVAALVEFAAQPGESMEKWEAFMNRSSARQRLELFARDRRVTLEEAILLTLAKDIRALIDKDTQTCPPAQP